MITHLEGKLVEKNPTDIVIDCNGIGYFVNISLHTFSQIPDKEHIKLYTHLQVKEDSHTLYGFSTLAEREIFRLLISVSGIGSSIARTMLSSLTPKQVREGIAVGDVALIQSIKGIGAKTAQRIVIDLKDKVAKDIPQLEISSLEDNTTKEEALSALAVLGFDRNRSAKVLQKIYRGQSSELTVEQVIKEALKQL